MKWLYCVVMGIVLTTLTGLVIANATPPSSVSVVVNHGGALSDVTPAGMLGFTGGVPNNTFNTYTSEVKKRFDNHSSIYVPIATYPLNSGQVASFTTGAIVQQQYSSTVRKAAASTAGVITLAALTGDVSISSPVTNQFLKYVGADWINATATFYGYSNYSSTHASILAGKQPSGSYVTQSQTINGTAYGSGNITIRDAGYLNYSTEGHHGTGGGGSGTVNSGTTGQFAYYGSNGTAVGGRTLIAGDIPALSYDASGAAAARQANLSLLAGTYTNGDVCSYASSGTLLNCNTALGGFATLSPGTLTSPDLCTSNGTTIACTTAPSTFQTANAASTGSAASLSVSGQTGLVTVTGLASTSRVKTVRDATDTILEVGGSYTPTGIYTNMFLSAPQEFITTSGLTQDNLYYLTSGGTWTATNATSGSNVARCYAISATQCMYSGVYTKTSHGFTVGATLYVAASSGTMTTTVPSSSGNMVQSVGWVRDANTLVIKPSNDYGTVQ